MSTPCGAVRRGSALGPVSCTHLSRLPRSGVAPAIGAAPPRPTPAVAATGQLPVHPCQSRRHHRHRPRFTVAIVWGATITIAAGVPSPSLSMPGRHRHATERRADTRPASAYARSETARTWWWNCPRTFDRADKRPITEVPWATVANRTRAPNSARSHTSKSADRRISHAQPEGSRYSA